MHIDLLSGAQIDLRGLRQSDPDVFAAVLAFLVEAAADEELINKCTSYGNVQINLTQVNVKRWVAASGIGNLFRIRILDTPATVYRVIYGFDWRSRRIGVLAVVHKDDFNYEITGELADRIRDDWFSATDGLYT
jgi:hypothetical protein